MTSGIAQQEGIGGTGGTTGTVVPAPGPAGSVLGSSGSAAIWENPQVQTTGSFVLPIVGETVSVPVTATLGVVPGTNFYLNDGTNTVHLQVKKVTSATALLMTNLPNIDNPAPGTTIAAAATILSPDGAESPNSVTYDLTAFTQYVVFPIDNVYALTMPNGDSVQAFVQNTANMVATTFTAFVQPAVGGTVTVTLTSTNLAAGFYLYHTSGGLYFVQSVGSGNAVLLSIGVAVNGTGTPTAPGGTVSGGNLTAVITIASPTASIPAPVAGLFIMPSSSGDWNTVTETDPYIKFLIPSMIPRYDGRQRCAIWGRITFPAQAPANDQDSANFGWVNGGNSNFTTFYSTKKGHILGDGFIWFGLSNSPGTSNTFMHSTANFSDTVCMQEFQAGPYAGKGTMWTGVWSNVTGWPTLANLNTFGSYNLFSGTGDALQGFWNGPNQHQLKLGAQRTGGTPGLQACWTAIRVDVWN